ncbi:hypothetical protein RJ639_020091 [Escallonia herrerae]|uniref:F-box domain-containing protein n=1 Tax=Escallonia herrerae TaxID=1293975 RepID=A0AA89AJ24_9ASTE|nr:hypothetical protein RJ639_020091 [Escallonia herrerae]
MRTTRCYGSRFDAGGSIVSIVVIQRANSTNMGSTEEATGADERLITLIEGEEEEVKGSTIVKDDVDITVLAELISKAPGKSEIMLEIFSRLSPPAVCKFRCVSKSMSKFTRSLYFAAKHSQNCRAISTSTFTGFFFQPETKYLDYYERSRKPKERRGDVQFVPIESEAGRLPDLSLTFLKQKNKRDEVGLIDSCNGLLLCNNTAVNRAKTYFVCNPLTKEKVALPHPGYRSMRSFFALLAGFTSTGYLQYRVVCLRRPKFGGSDSCSKLSMLSSRTGEWEELGEELPPLCHETMMGSKVFVNGRLFWDCLEGHILICHLNTMKNHKSYDLIEAPRAPLGRCLWKFEEKLRCYCHGFPDEYPAWYLNTNDKKDLKWGFDGSAEFETLTEDISVKLSAQRGIRTMKEIQLVRFRIIGYIPESETLFLYIPDSLYSYQLSKKRLEFVGGATRTWKYHSPSCVFPFVHSFAPMQTWTNAEQRDGNNDAMGDFTEVNTLYETSGNKSRRKKSRRKTRDGAR